MNLKEELVKAEEQRRDNILRESYNLCKKKLSYYYDLDSKVEFNQFYKTCPKCGRKNSAFCMNYQKSKFCILCAKLIGKGYAHIIWGKNLQDEEIFEVYFCDRGDDKMNLEEEYDEYMSEDRIKFVGEFGE